MKKDVIYEVFRFLKGKGIAVTESEFSEDWLGASESYLRKLRSAQTEPSLGTVAVCASRLMNAAEQLRQLPRYRHLAEQFSAVSSKCRKLVDADSVEFDLIKCTLNFKDRVMWRDFGRNINDKDTHRVLEKEDAMSLIASLKLVEYRPEAAQGRIFVRRRKLAEKIDQQINLAADAAYAPSKIITVTDESGILHRREVAKRIKRWWIVISDGSVQLTVRYVSKPIELAKGKNAIECANAGEIRTVLSKVKDAVLNGELDTALEGVTVAGRNRKKA